MTVEPFRVHLPQQTLDGLRRQLAATCCPDAFAGVGWDQGIPLDDLRDLRDLCEYRR